ncbi:MAG: inorganic phosphate transporter [Proteobacteria bacterium]|nr:inorganic phosphate transporter [Pseudomonadota bacterium]
MPEGLLPLLPILALVLAAEFVNGWTDAPNAIATVISTRVMTPVQALAMAVVLNFVGTMSGTAVALTVGKGIVRPEVINVQTIAAAMVGNIIWGNFARYYGLPTSSTHALVSGLAGASIATAGFSALQWEGWRKVFVGLGFSTFLGFLGGFLLMLTIYRVFRRARPGWIRKIFGRLQIVSAAFMAFSHGCNDGQKFMGVFTLTLVIGGVLPEFKIPIWVIVICALTIGLGTALGGWKIVRTIGVRLTKLEPVQGFAAETGAAVTIEIASRLGIPLSTTHTINTSIMGVGTTRKFSAIRWGVGGEIVTAWIFTFPVCALIGWATCLFFKLIF